MTLRSLAGLHDDPAPITKATLVVIDAQRAYAQDGALPLEGIEPATQHIVGLLESARSLGTPVIHIAHHGGDGSPFDPRTGGRFLPTVEPLQNEIVVTKALPNAFAGTELLKRLRDRDATQLILCGFMTHMCVSATARAALDLGYETTIASDATATRNLPEAVGNREVPAAIVQSATLAALADRFSVVTTTARLTAVNSEQARPSR